MTTFKEPLSGDRESNLPAPKKLNNSYNAELTEYINRLKKVNEELKQARRAALNLMEDTILSKDALRASESRLAALVEAVPIAIGMLDVNGKVILSNKEMKHF